MNLTLDTLGLNEHIVTGCLGLAKLSISRPFRISGSSAAPGIELHESVTLVGLGCADGEASARDGETAGLGVAEGVGDGTSGDGVCKEKVGEGVDAKWLVAPGLPHAHATVTTAIAMPIRTRFMYRQR